MRKHTRPPRVPGTTTTETNRVGSNTVVSIDVFLPATFLDISNRVTIDWGADIRSLQTAKLPSQGRRPFNVITLKNGRMRSYEGREPNMMIWEYLESLKGTNSGTAEPVP